MESSPHPDSLCAQVLIVEDEPEHADVMADALRKPGHISTIVGTVDEAMEELRHGAFDVIVTDLRMPSSGGSHGVAPDGADAGMKILTASRALQPESETIMVTAHGDVPTARAAFKHGAFDFIEKPLDLDLFRALINRAAETVLLRHQSGELADLVQHDGFEGIIAGSEPMLKILQIVRTVAASSLPVLVTGESGVGKELIAQAVHRISQRAGKRLATFNCAGQSEFLVEDQLFGHMRGAFTGAEKERKGVFEYADGGTVFLDEIGDMSLAAQAKLLRVLENKEVVRIGSNEPRTVDVRFVSATNHDLDAAIKSGDFREDLFFRINGAHVHIPPLRQRREDIPRIVRHAIASSAAELNAPPPDIADSVTLRLTSYHWPGNVRQLLNVVQNMVVMTVGAGQSVIDLPRIPPDITADDDAPLDTAGGSLAGTSLEQLEKRAIRETLRLTGGNREQTAKLLGIGERTLYRKLKEYGLR